MDLDFNQFGENIETWLSDNGVFILWTVFIAFIVSFVAKFLISRLVDLAVRDDTESGESHKREKTLASLLYALARVVIWTSAIMVLLSHFNVNLAALTASAGILGVVIGFGAQDLVKNLIAGVFVIVENQYRINDLVELNGISGKVDKISLRTTVLRDIEGNVHHIPNGQINTTTNKTIDFSKISMPIEVDYGSDFDKIEKTVNKLGIKLAGDKEFGHMIIDAPQFWRITEFGASGIEFKIIAKTKPGSQWAVAARLRRIIVEEFDKSGISFAYPHLVVKQSPEEKPKKATRKPKPKAAKKSKS